MNITAINNNYNNKKTGDIAFKSSQLISATFMAINKHEILGVSAIDLLSMVIPRSIIDFTRNKEAGTETAIREASSTATHAAIGVAGIGAATLLAQGLKHKGYNVDFKSITANDDTVENLAKVFKTVVDENQNVDEKQIRKIFLEKVFSNVEGLGGNSENLKNTTDKIWYGLSKENQNAIVNEISKQMDQSKSFKLPSKTASLLEAYLNIDIPSTQNLRVKLGDKAITTKGEHFIADAYALTKSFMQKNVLETFKTSTDITNNMFVQDLKKLSIRKTSLGLAAICAVALSTQAINRHLTQKRTGIKGFVGDPNYSKHMEKGKEPKKKDHTFLPLKLLAVLGMGFYIFKTLNASSLRDLISKVQFKGSLPTVNQIKVVYGSTILGRLLASSDKNELRESAFRDFLGYTNFLVLGALVTKCFVNFKDKTLINYDAETQGKGLWNWLKNSSIKTHEEVINSTLKSSVIKENKVLSLKEIYKNGWIRPDGSISSKLGILNKAKLIGMLYACIALGIIVPLINKHMTEGKKDKNLIKKQIPNQKPELQHQQLPNKANETSKAQQIINEFFSKQNIM